MNSFVRRLERIKVNKDGLLSLLFVLVSPSCLADSVLKLNPQQPLSDINLVWKAAEQSMSAWVEKADSSTGISAVVVSRQGKLWSAAKGHENPIKPLTTDSSMLMGSVSKVFTSIALMQLVEQGKIDLNLPVTHYLPELTWKTHQPYEKVFTIKDLMTHSSGLPGDISHGFYLDAVDNPQVTAYRGLPTLMANTYLVEEPRKNHGYSNLAFSLLGLVIERVSKEYFPDYMVNNILSPLGMSHSSFLLDERIADHISFGSDGKHTVPYPFIRDIAAGSLAASANDMANFMIALLNQGQGILEPATLGSMFSWQNAQTIQNDGNAPRMGLGFCIQLNGPLSAVPLAWHNGGVRSDSAIMLLLPEAGIGISVMSSFPADVEGLAENIAIDLYKRMTNDELKPLRNAEKVSFSKAQLKQLPGHYFSTNLGKIWEILPNGSSLKIKTDADETLHLVPNSAGYFDLKYKWLGFIPIEIAELNSIQIRGERIEQDTNALSLSINNAGMITGNHFSKLTPVAIPESWKKRVGRYQITDANALSRNLIRKHNGSDFIDIYWDEESHFLFFGSAELSLPLRPIDKTKAILMGKGRNTGDTVEVLPDGSLFYSGYHLKKIG